MAYAFSYCPKDMAGANITSHFLQMIRDRDGIEPTDPRPITHGTLSLLGGHYLIETENQHIFADNMDNDLGGDVDGVIFISRHKSESGRPCLTVHAMGNYLNAKGGGGGRSGHLTPAMPLEEGLLLRALDDEKRKRGLSIPVSYEATHHGPAMSLPALNIEIGSDEGAWSRAELGMCVASAIYHVFFGEKAWPPIPRAIGIGGGHYAPRFTDVTLRFDLCFGHIVPNYVFEGVNRAEEELKIIEKAFKATPSAEYVYFDRKALKGERTRRYRSMAEGLGLIPVRTKDLEPRKR